ncbi:MAG: hypothetical protein RL077_5846 [Verrucomicrobiota bacterium]
MLRALLYLRFMSGKNWLTVRGQRLRQPKYLAGAIVGGAYFYFFFIRSFQGVATPPPLLEAVHSSLPLDVVPLIAAIGSLALLAIVALLWLVPTEPATLGFTEAEIAFLFPAPISRRALIHFRLLSAQLRSLLGAGIMMLFSQRWTFIGGNALTHTIGWWFIFSALNLHFSGAAFTLSRCAALGLGLWRRRLGILFTVGTCLGLTCAHLPATEAATALAPANTWPTFIQNALILTETAPLRWLLWPCQRLLGPFFAENAPSFFASLPAALALLTLHYLWVVNSAVAFADTAIEQAQKQGTRNAAWRAGAPRLSDPTRAARPDPFTLAGSGRPEFAFLWKNLLSTSRYFTPRVFGASAALILAGCLWLSRLNGVPEQLPVIGVGALIFAGYTLIIGPQFARQDIRQDFAHADILKTYPLAGWQIILGELLTPIILLTSLVWLALLTAACSLPNTAHPHLEISLSLRITGIIASGLITPALVALQLLVPNAAALVFPSWFHTSRTRGGGPEVIGQRLIFFFAQLLTMTCALLPPLGGGALLIFIWQGLLGPTAAVAIASFFVLAILIGEVAGGIWLLGAQFERVDLSLEIRT